MRFAIGYQQPGSGEPFSGIVRDYLGHIEEVYFAWVGAPSGRARLGADPEGKDESGAEEVLEREICEIRKMGVRLDLLFNANCYGRIANSARLEENVVSTMAHIDALCGLPEVVTTTSPAIAHTVRKNFPGTETRASVNMRIGTMQAMEYAAHLFDSFYLQRDLQRDLGYVERVHGWCKINGKKLCILANSGCLRFCPGQIFHDNAVAHDAETGGDFGDIKGWNPHLCWKLYSDKGKVVEFLKSTWIRPEDIKRYEGLVDLAKLATRQNTHPRMILEAYTSGRFDGNLMNLMEPCFSSLLAPKYIDNSAFPADWAGKISSCPGDCCTCDYCAAVLESVLKSYE